MSKENDVVFNNLIDVPHMEVNVHGLTDQGFFQKKNYSKIFGIPGGLDVSPKVSWSNVPKDAKSIVITMYDPDAPTESGFWHWSVKDIPVTITELPENAGTVKGDLLPSSAVAMPMDAGMKQYVGAAPSKGDTPHRYHIVVTALDVEILDVSPDSSPAFMNFNMMGHELARGYQIIYAQI